MVFQYGDQTYGPYTVREDPTAIPEGNVLDPMEPSDILNPIAGPELTHKGDWFFWFGGMVICIANAILVLFADELFRWNLAFQIRNPEQAEPSDWAIASRRICLFIGTFFPPHKKG